MEEPILTKFDPNDFPIVQLTLASKTLTGGDLTRIADPGLTRQLRGVTGVAEVRVVGGIEREMTIELKPQALQAAGVGVGEVVQALQTQNLAAPVGRLNGALDERTIRLLGRLDTPADFERIVIAQRSGRLIRLGDVAEASDGTEEPRTAALFNGRDAVGIDIIKADGYSATEVSERVGKRVDEIRKTLPAGVELITARDAGPRVANSVADVQGALIEGAALTVLVVFLFLNSWRSTVITGLALPVSVMASFVAVWAFGFTLDTMSLLGLSLAIGILIDDAIVVRENIVRHVEMGKDHYTAVAGRHRRDRPGRRRDDAVDRRGVRAGGVHGRPGRAVVQAVRADHRLLGAGVAVRVVLARPDAVGVLARPAPDARTALVARAAAGAVQQLVRPAGGALQAGHRLGARPPLRDGGAGRSPRSSARWRCRRSASSAARSCRTRISPSS